MARAVETAYPTVVASAAMVRLADESTEQLSTRAKRIGTALAWQIEAWRYYGEIGAVWYSHAWKGNAIGHLDWQVGIVDADGDVVPARNAQGAAVEGVDGALLSIAQDALDRLVGVAGSHSAWARPLGVALSCVAEGWLVGYSVNEDGDPVESEVEMNGLMVENPEAIGEQWEAYSPTALIRETGDVDPMTGKPRLRVKVRRSQDGDPTLLPRDTILVRIFRRHPEYPDDPDGPMRPLLDTCDDLLMLQRAVRGSALSRTHAGLLLIPREGLGLPGNAYSLVVENGNGDGPPPNPVVTEIIAGLSTPHRDPGSAATLVPTAITTGSAHINEWRHLPLDRTIDPELRLQREELLRAYATGVDLPPERLLGMADLNHWTAWEVGEDSWRHVDPDAKTVAAGMTTGYLWPSMLEALEDLNPDVVLTAEQRKAVRRFRVTYDPTAVIISPDKSDDADGAFDRGAISWPAYRKYKHFNEADAPTPEELEARRALGFASKGPASTTVSPGPPQSNQPGAAASTTITRGDVTVVLAAPTPDELFRFSVDAARMEARFLRDVLVMADSQIDEAVRKAQARLRSKAQADPALRSLVRGVPLDQVPRVLGRRECARLAAFASDEDPTIESLFDGALLVMAAKYQRMGSAVQAAYRTRAAALLDQEFDDAEVEQQDRDLTASEGVLLGGATAYAVARLFDQVAAAEQVGEVPSGVSLPIALVRRASAAAGGVPTAPGFTPLDRWEGGILTGTTPTDQLAARGLVATGLVWVYGDPGTRQQTYEPHYDLDGQTARDPSGFFGFEPGDHNGCQCSWASTWSDGSIDEGEDDGE